MKKLICILLVAMVLWGLCLSVSASKAETHDWADFENEAAGTTTLFLSEDFSTLTVGSETYHRMDASAFDAEYYWSDGFTVPLTDTQKLQVKKVTIDFAGDKIIANVTLYYQDGAILTADYVKDSQRDTLIAMLEDENTEATVEYWGTVYQETKAPIKNFRGTPMVLNRNILEYASQFEVFSIKDALHIRCQLGIVLAEDGKFYYVDFRENDIIANHFDIWSYSTLNGYEITDEGLVKSLEENTAVYYSDGIGALYDDDFTEVLSVAVLILVFGIIPGAVLILAVIMLIRNKAYQRLTWAVTAGLAGGELAVFSILVGVFLNL